MSPFLVSFTLPPVILRTKLAFRKEGFENVKGAHADYFVLMDLYSLTREFFGYYKYLLRPNVVNKKQVSKLINYRTVLLN